MGAWWCALRRWLGLAGPASPVAVAVAAIVEPGSMLAAAPVVVEPSDSSVEVNAPTPAIAVRSAADFMLPARLPSVAKLNCPQGRKPRIEKRRASNAHAAVPSSRLGAKRSRPTQGDQRVLANCRHWRTAEIIAFPGAYRAPSNEPAVMDLVA